MMLKLIRGLHNLELFSSGCVATIGNFDGVHLGHQTLLKQLKTLAEHYQLPAVVILFEPQPNEYFARQDIPPRLMRLRDKLIAIKPFNINYVVCLRFNAALANIPAENFIVQILLGKLAIKHLIIGDDFRFGYKRLGDYQLLQHFGKQHNFQVEAMPTYEIANERVSSSRIRRLLMNHDFKTATVLLGKPYCISGHVAHGDKLGRTLGFPTINIFPCRKAIALHGVYVVKVHGIQNKPLTGVANVGTRPVVHGKKTLVEVFIFDFTQTIYGHYVTVEFMHKLRNEMPYANLELLTEQMHQDVAAAKQYLSFVC